VIERQLPDEKRNPVVTAVGLVVVAFVAAMTFLGYYG
jgi:hypothetical protein